MVSPPAPPRPRTPRPRRPARALLPGCAQVCLPSALPAASLEMANLWVGGELMKNGLHFDNYDNLLHQIRGRKRALLFPPEDTQYLYYGAASIHRHEFGLPGGVSNQTTFEKVRNTARPFPSPSPSMFTLTLASSTVIASYLISSHLVSHRSVTTWPWSTSSLTTSAPPTRWCARPPLWSASWTRATHSSCPAGDTAWAEAWAESWAECPCLQHSPRGYLWVRSKVCPRAQGYLLGTRGAVQARSGAPLPAWGPTRGYGAALYGACPKVANLAAFGSHPGGTTP